MKFGSHLTAGLVIATSILINTHTAQASDISFTPRASLSLTSYKFSQTARPGALAGSGLTTEDFPEVTFDVTFKILGVGGTFFKDGYYLDLSAQKSTEEEDSFTFEDPALVGFGFSDGKFKETFKGDRQDLTITFGKKVLDNQGGIYIGYKSGKSEASGNVGTTLTFEEKGLFVGANYGWPVASGRVSINIAFADLEGNLEESVDNNPVFNSLPIPLGIDATSDAQGLSYGVSWSSRLTDTISYSVSVDTKKYTFDNIKDSDPAAIPSSEFEEELTSAMLSFYFQY